MAVKPVPYAAIYLWECPDCGTTWQARHRPRAGALLVCAPQPEQVAVGGMPSIVHRGGCASMNTSAGRRKGIAPHVSI